MLKPCPYRKFNNTDLECKITLVLGTEYTTLTSVDICSNCSISDIIQQVNCKNIIPSKLNELQLTTDRYGHQYNILNGTGFRINCQVIQFENLQKDYQNKCSSNCPAFQPIHRDLSNEELILIPEVDEVKATDRNLRQAVLLILYKYHTLHPERYRDFDVTPEFIAKSLNIDVKDVVRVVQPMEDEQEIETESYLNDVHFRYVRITSKGIRMIDESPLFNRLDTADVRNININSLTIGNNNQHQGDIMSDSIKNENDLRQANIANFANQLQDNSSQNASDFSQNINQNIDEINKLINSLREIAQQFPEEQRQQAIVHLDDLEEDIASPKKQTPERIKTRIDGLLKTAAIVGTCAVGLADFTNNVLQIGEKLNVQIDPNQIQIIQQLPASNPNYLGQSPNP
jgi:DNA-binding MarR family transcriptional regulator